MDSPMDRDVEDVVEEFRGQPRRLAVFDRDIRERTGEWELETTVPLERILQVFRGHPALHSRAGTVVPLHEADSPTPTGEFVILSHRGTEPLLEFHDFGSGRSISIPAETAAATYPAYRLRLWADSLSGSTAGVRDEDQRSGVPTGPVSQSPPSPTDRRDHSDPALFEQVRSFLDRIREKEIRSARQQLAAVSVTRLPDVHPGIPTSSVVDRRVDRTGRQVITFEVADSQDVDCDVPEAFGVYPGSIVLVAPHDDRDGLPVRGRVTAIAGGRVDLVVDWETSTAKGPAEATLAPGSDAQFGLAQLFNPVPYDRQARAVAAIEDDPAKRDVLTGERRPEFASVRDGQVVTTGLNDSQVDAVDKAHRARDVVCIHGPPGTGKTRTLTRIIRGMCTDHDQVLACAHSNQAVDNLLVGSSTLHRDDPRSLHAAAQEGELSIVRVGGSATHPVVQEYYTDEEYHHADVVATTTNGAHRFRTNQFDVAVVDEASQATIPATLVPYAKASRLILAGDHKQLPPYHSTERDADEDMEVSLFEQLLSVCGDRCHTTLRTQYRMHEAIAEFPNREFYDGILDHGGRNRSWRVGEFEPLVGIDVAGSEARSPGNSYYNELEATAVAREVSRLLHGGVSVSSIGVITPYTAQIGKINAAIDEILISESVSEIAVDTVDSFQGGQRDVIIVSFVRSNDDGRTGFLTFPEEGPRRLTVAVTRAKKRLVLVGDWETLRTVGPGKTVATSCAPLYDRLYQHLVANDALEEWPIRAPATY